MSADTLGLRRILTLVRAWALDLDAAEQLIRDHFREGVTPSDPVDPAPSLPGPPLA